VRYDLACCAGADSVDIFYFFITSKNLFIGFEQVLGLDMPNSWWIVLYGDDGGRSYSWWPRSCWGITLTGYVGNVEASFSFGDDGSEASLNFGTSGDDSGRSCSWWPMSCWGITLTCDVGNIEASFSFGDNGSEAFLNFGTSGDDVGRGASLSFSVTVWLNNDISWFFVVVGPSKTISRRFHSMN
jgi:hypothetical protein